MNNIVDDIIKIMIRNRRKYPKYWEKVRLDRLSKLIPSHINGESVIELIKTDERFKHTLKQDDYGNLIPAVKLRYKTYISRYKTYIS